MMTTTAITMVTTMEPTTMEIGMTIMAITPTTMEITTGEIGMIIMATTLTITAIGMTTMATTPTIMVIGLTTMVITTAITWQPDAMETMLHGGLDAKCHSKR